ncbi:MAG: hypothetical protein HC888_01220 [Candidatus Competibacteraceae bacterium]|nr:hypothetical protein [Candidatus Competibacteraceae bacterium]
MMPTARTRFTRFLKPTRSAMILLLLLAPALQQSEAESIKAPETLRLGQRVEIQGMPYHFLRKEGDNLVFTPPLDPAASLGAMIAPVSATVSSFQEGTPRTGETVINGSGLGELWAGSGLYVHTSNPFADGASMWNADFGDKKPSFVFDLGGEYKLSGFYAWNYNEGGQFLGRGVKEFAVSVSQDGTNWKPVGDFTLPRASGKDDYKGHAMAFQTPQTARYVKLEIQSNHGGDTAGLSEIRFANAEKKQIIRNVSNPKYERPSHPKLALGVPLKGAENIIFPKDFGHVDVTKPPYNAKGDGISDDTAAIQKALLENQGSIIYLPNGRYLISDTLRWPGSNPTGTHDYKYTALQGQSRAGTIIQLRDQAPGFDSARKSRPVIWTGPEPAQRFSNEVFNLTVDTGTGNPGASGLHFNASNSGGIYDVTVISGDGHGVTGIDFGFTGEVGPLLARNIKVVGFDVGISTASGVNSQTLENIELKNQNVAGIRNAGQVLSIRNLESLNAVPAILAANGLLSIENATLTGLGEADETSAIINGGWLNVRSITAPGYKQAIQNNAGNKQSPEGVKVAEFVTPSPEIGFASPPVQPLPVRETPESPWESPDQWVSIRKFIKEGVSASKALQEAIDSGAQTIYLPGGGYKFDSTVVLRGKLRRLIGEKAWINLEPDFRQSGHPIFRLEDGDSPTVWIERLNTDFSAGKMRFLDHESKRTLVLRQVSINLHAGKTGTGYRAGENAGTVFIEDVVGPAWEFRKQDVWARQLNAEVNGTHIYNDGANLWILGLKTERTGTIIDTRGGGRTEVFGGLIYNIGQHGEPMFTVENGTLSATVAEMHYADMPYQQFVVEKRGSSIKNYGVKGPFKGGRSVIYRSGPVAGP